MERPSSLDQLPSLHIGYYETTSFEVIRAQIATGDHVIFKTQTGSVYSFIITAIERSRPYGEFVARGTLIHAPQKMLYFEKGGVLHPDEGCLLIMNGTNSGLQIIREIEADLNTDSHTIPTVTTSPVIGYGIRKSN